MSDKKKLMDVTEPKNAKVFAEYLWRCVGKKSLLYIYDKTKERNFLSFISLMRDKWAEDTTS